MVQCGEQVRVTSAPPSHREGAHEGHHLCGAGGSRDPRTRHLTTWYIQPDGTGDLPTIEAAFSIAAYGDSVVVASGIYDEHDLWIPGGVLLLSETQVPSTAPIDAGGLGRCLSASASGAIVRGVTLRNGTHAVEGGLGLMDAGSVSFHSCVFVDGAAPIGGAFSVVRNGGASFYDCRFESNEATWGARSIWRPR